MAKDMEREGRDASTDSGARVPGADARPAARHGALRQRSGIGIAQLVNEFGSVRTIVLTRWYFSGARTDSDAVLQQSIRFNRAVDGVLCDAAESFAAASTSARDTYLFTLGQDLRGPLSAIHIASIVLGRPDFGPATRHNASRRVGQALAQMDGLLSDLLEYTRNRAVPGIPVDSLPCDLAHVCAAAIESARASHPARVFDVATSGDLVASVDGPRIQQALSNLVHNAVKHGDGHTAIKLAATGDDTSVALSVWNAGRAIPEASLEAIFEPWVRVPREGSAAPGRPETNLGLGLFIAREIVAAHGGTIGVSSSAAAGTRFTIRLPRMQATAPAVTAPASTSAAAHLRSPSLRC
jgi:signal transduction histidine kinase